MFLVHFVHKSESSSPRRFSHVETLDRTFLFLFSTHFAFKRHKKTQGSATFMLHTRSMSSLITKILIVICLVFVYKRQQTMKCLLRMLEYDFKLRMVMMYVAVIQYGVHRKMGVMTLMSKSNKKRRRLTNYYIKPRSLHWFERHFCMMDDFDFRRLFRFPRNLFQQLVDMYGANLERHPPPGLRVIPNRYLHPSKVIAIALHRLGTGGSDVVVGTIFGVSGNTVYRATERFVDAVLNSDVGPQLEWCTDLEKLKIKRDFEKIAGIPNCVGAIDCTHIPMECPPNAVAIEWRDRTQKYSMVLQAIVSPSMKILDICTGWPGSVHDQRIFYTSSFGMNISERLHGPEVQVDGGDFCVHVPEHIIGDAGYMQQVNVMTPYSQGQLTLPHASSYNDAHSATRKCVECTFGRLKNQWQFLDSMHICICLHTFVFLSCYFLSLFCYFLCRKD